VIDSFEKIDRITTEKLVKPTDPTRQSIMDSLLKDTLDSLYDPTKEPLQSPCKENLKKKTEEFEEEDVLENVIKSFEKTEISKEKNNEFSDPLDLILQFEANEKVRFFS